MDSLNILFLGGAKRVSLAESFIESGKERGLDVRIFSYEIDENVPISFIGKVILGKKWNADDILDHLEETIIKENIHILLPSVDPATIVAANLKSFTKTKCFIPVPDPSLCRTFFHKQLTYDWCVQNHIPVPGAELIFPLIAKPVNGSASVGIQKLLNQVEFDEFWKHHDHKNYNIQKYINGTEFSVDVYVSTRSKKLIVCVPRIRLETLGGESVKSLTVRKEELITLSKKIVDVSGLIGPLTIQFIQDKVTKESYLMEVNPRFGGAVVCSIGAGADLPGFLIDDFLGKELTEQNQSWKSNILMVRRFSEFFRETTV